jgi:hypothetical protein
LAEREERLERAIQRELREGARLESREATSAVLVRGRRVNHALHFGLSLVTLGWWVVGGGLARLGATPRETLVDVSLG